MGVVTYSNFGDRIISEVRDGEERDYVRDTLGSTAELVDETGTVTDTFEYWPYGEVRMRSGTTATPFSWVGTLGYYSDPLLQILYVRARFERSDLARWLTVDPSWPQQSAYTYALNNPIVAADPLGSMPELLLMLDRKRRYQACTTAAKEIESRLSGGGSPMGCGAIRRCIGQYLENPAGAQCGHHGGGHGFSGLFGLGCCVQVEIDLCVLLSPIKHGACASIPPCLEEIIKQNFGGRNPIAGCMCSGEERSPCPPGYTPTYYLFPGFGPYFCDESTIRLPT